MTHIDMRLSRANDELDQYGPQPVVGTLPARNAQVLAEPWITLPPRAMCQPYHVEDQKFKITPGWCEFIEVTFDGVSLCNMEPQEWPPGTLLYLECVVRWAVASGVSNGVNVTHKSGAYTIRRAEVKPSTTALAISEGPPDLSISASDLDRDWTRRFLLGTIADRAVMPSQNGFVYLSAGSGFNAYDLAMLAFF